MSPCINLSYLSNLYRYSQYIIVKALKRQVFVTILFSGAALQAQAQRQAPPTLLPSPTLQGVPSQCLAAMDLPLMASMTPVLQQVSFKASAWSSYLPSQAFCCCDDDNEVKDVPLRQKTVGVGGCMGCKFIGLLWLHWACGEEVLPLVFCSFLVLLELRRGKGQEFDSFLLVT